MTRKSHLSSAGIGGSAEGWSTPNYLKILLGGTYPSNKNIIS